MLKTTNLFYSYDNETWIDFPDIVCESDQHYLVLGHSGKGKTTFLHLCAGLLQSEKGSVMVNDTDITKLSGKALDRFRGDHIGIIFQQAHFMGSLNVVENLMIAQKLAGKSMDKNAIASLLDKLNIGHKLDARTNNLSQGEKQRVAIARALINKPSVILADEPTSALDDSNCNEVVDLLEKTADEVNATLIIVTHDNRLMNHFSNQIQLS